MVRSYTDVLQLLDELRFLTVLNSLGIVVEAQHLGKVFCVLQTVFVERIMTHLLAPLWILQFLSQLILRFRKLLLCWVQRLRTLIRWLKQLVEYIRFLILINLVQQIAIGVKFSLYLFHFSIENMIKEIQ